MPTRIFVPGPHEAVSLTNYEPTLPQNGQVQVLLKATSLNPLDWKRIAKSLHIPSYPHVVGMDVVGVVSNKGTSTVYEVGDRIMGVGSVGWSDGGSFQTYVLIHEKDSCKIPERISVSDAATMPFALATAACSLYLELGIPLPSANPAEGTPTVLGASGSVGSFAVQLAKASGSKVIATCSLRSTEYIKKQGADEVFDLSDAAVVSKIRAVAPDLRHAFDTKVTEESVGKCVDCFGGEPGTVCTAIMYKDSQSRTQVTFKPTYSGRIQGKKMGPGFDSEGAKLGSYLWQHLGALIEAEKIRPVQYEIIGGLETVPLGLKRVEEGKYNSKLVVEVLDTE